MTITDAMRARLRAARKKLATAACTCDGKHDPFWMRYPRALAEVERDDVLAAMGVVVW